MDVCPPTELGLGDGTSKAGVANTSVATGDENEDGVEACSVASRSGVGEEPGVKSPHPKRKISAVIIQESFVLFMIQFN